MNRNFLVAVLISFIAISLFLPCITTAGQGCKDLAGDGEIGIIEKSISSGGYLRTYKLYIPPKYKSNLAQLPENNEYMMNSRPKLR